MTTATASSLSPRTTINILLEGNCIHDNGNSGSLFEHNVYVEAIGVTYQYNHFGPPLPGAGGNNDFVHYGGDTGSAQKLRKGTPNFYNNLVSDRTDNTRLFRLSRNDESCDARNNIAYVTAAGANLQLLDNYGHLTLTQNWFKTGYTPFVVNRPKGTITDNGTVTGSSPGFVSEAGQDCHLISGSQAIDAGAALNPAVLPTHNVVREYVKHQSSVARAVYGTWTSGPTSSDHGAGRESLAGLTSS